MATSLVPPGFNASTPQSPVAETSPAASSTNVSSFQTLLERSDIEKSLKALEGLVSLLYDYTQLWQGLVSLDKKLVKALKDAGGLKSVEWPSTVLLTSSLIFDSVQEVDSKFSKLVEREYETCTQELKKWTKKLKKEDKALDEYTTAANAKIKAAGQAYEKKAKRGIASSPSGPSLDSYSALLSTVSSSVSSAKHQHALFTSTRHVTALYTISGSAGRIADAQWMKTCDLLRRCGGHVGILGESRSYVEAGWRGGVVVELPLNLPIHAGPPAVSPMTSPIEAPPSTYPNARVPNSDPLTPSIGYTNAKQEGSSKSATNSHDLLETIAKELKSPADDPPRHPRDGVQKITTTDAEPSRPRMPEPVSTGTSKDTKMSQQTSDAKGPLDDKHDTVKITNSTGTTRTTATIDTMKTDATHSSNGTSAKDTVSSESDFKEQIMQTTSPTTRDQPNPPVISSRSVVEHSPDGPPKPDPTKPAPLNTGVGHMSPKSPREGDFGTYFPSAVKPTPKSPAEILSPTPIFATHSTTSQDVPAMPQAPQAHPGLPQAPTSYAGRAMGRTRSIDSTASSGSLVAAMRDRYNPASPPPTSMPPSARRETFSGRDREGGKVSDMASRFTPIEGPLDYDPRYPRSGFPASPPPFGRGLTDNSTRSGDSLPLRTPLIRSSVDEFGNSFSAGTPTRRPGDLVDRRHPPPMPSHMVAGPSYDMRFSELELQERELELKRRELQLAREREALKARERGHDFHDDSEKEGSAYDWRRRGGEDERHRMGDAGYESASSRDFRPGPYGRTVSRREDEGYGYDTGTPRMNTANHSGSYRDKGFGTGSRNPGPNVPYNDISTGLGVMGLGLPPGAGPSAVHSRESLPLAAESTPYLGPPRSTAPSAASRSRDPSPRRSADMVNTHITSTARQNEKEKGGTWLGKGLKRFSMPLGAGSNN